MAKPVSMLVLCSSVQQIVRLPNRPNLRLQSEHAACRTLPNGTRTPGLGRRIALDVARGLHFLHSRRVVHFDLKSANILLARDHTAKIADVGLAKIMHRQFLSTLFNVGTFAWSAPEVRFLISCVT